MKLTMAQTKFELKGVGGRLFVFDDKVVIEPKGLLGLAKGLGTGAKTIPMDSIKSVQFKKGSIFTNGFIQFGILGGNESLGGIFNAAGDENSVVFKKGDNELAEQIKEYVEGIILNRSKAQHAPQISSADEIMKFKTLLDQGIISQDEFDRKKKEILGF